MIKVNHLKKSFGDQVVLEDINFEVRQGELLVIFGSSGSGKSVLLRHVIGLLKPDQGHVEIDGQELTHMSERHLLELRKDMGYLFQEGALYDFMSVYENVAFPLKEHTRLKKDQIQEKVMVLLKMIGLEAAADKYPSELSGGMKKRVALARSVILDTKVLLCDEPTSGLDPLKSREIFDLITSLTRRLNCTTVITSHDMPNSFRIADRLILIQGGHVIAQGAPDELKQSKESALKDFLEEGFG